MMENKISAPRERTMYIELLRIISMVAVVAIHLTGAFILEISPKGFNWQVLNIWRTATQFAVPVFVMISGSLFLDCSREMPIKKLYGKYILRLVTAFAFWSLFYAIFMFFIRQDGGKKFAYRLIDGHFHLWYITMLIFLYILVPVLKLITANRTVMKYFLLLWIVITLFWGNLIKYDFMEPFRIAFKGNAYYSFTNGFVGYFVAGYFLATEDFSKKQQKIIYVLGALGFVLTAGLTCYFSIKGGNTKAYYSNGMLGVCLMAIAVFVFGKYELSRIKFSEKGKKFICYLSSLTFGGYLIHMFFKEVLEMLGIHALTFNPLISMPLFTVLISLLSLGSAAIIKKIPFFKKYFC